MRLGLLDAHTAPVTRHIVNAALWLFAAAMAYPYLPGAQTEAFKGLTVILGLMVSIGASGLIGQVASGVILVYTRALSLGDYVRIQDCEGTVTEIGLFVTRLRTGLGAE
jgi:small-conductance mechanosensitive channel